MPMPVIFSGDGSFESPWRWGSEGEDPAGEGLPAAILQLAVPSSVLERVLRGLRARLRMCWKLPLGCGGGGGVGGSLSLHFLFPRREGGERTRRFHHGRLAIHAPSLLALPPRHGDRDRHPLNASPLRVLRGCPFVFLSARARDKMSGVVGRTSSELASRLLRSCHVTVTRDKKSATEGGQPLQFLGDVAGCDDLNI